MSLMSVSNESTWGRVISVISHLLRCTMGRMEVLCPFRGKRKLQLRGCWNRFWTENDSHIYKGKIFASFSWIKSVILITLDVCCGGLDGWDHSIKIVVIYHEEYLPAHNFFLFFRLKSRQNWTVKWRSSEDNHPFVN